MSRWMGMAWGRPLLLIVANLYVDQLEHAGYLTDTYTTPKPNLMTLGGLAT